MSNIIDYLKWRGDILMSASPFNQVDNLILSQFAYMPLEQIVTVPSRDFEISIGGFSKALLEKNLERYSLFPVENDRELLTQLSVSNRFKDLIITNHINDVNIPESKQFAAYTILLSENDLFVAFRGTDNTIIGWKEDFDMAYEDAIPAQTESVEYLNNVGKIFNGTIYVGGHSKGGNLAVYSASHCNEQVRSRIAMVFNNDGPGLNNKEMLTPGYISIQDRLCTLLPQSSIVGMLLAHAEHYDVIKSESVGLLQHIPYFWQVEVTKFITVEKINVSSSLIDDTIKKLENSMSIEERHTFFETLFDVISATGAVTLQDLTVDKFKKATAILNATKNIDEKTRKLLFDVIGKMFSSGTQTIVDSTIKKVKIQKRSRSNSKSK